MSSYASIRIGRHPLDWFRNGVPADVLYLFQREQLVVLPAGEVLTEAGPDDEVRVLRASVRTLRDRMDVSGTGIDDAAAAYSRHLIEEIVFAADPGDTDAEREDLARLRCDSHAAWLERATAYLRTPPQDLHHETLERLLDDWERDEARFVLRSFLEASDPDELVTIELEDLMDAGWVDADIDPHAYALDVLRQPVVPAILVTEGRSDAEAISMAMSVLRPHLVPYVRVLDYGAKPEGGADAALRTVRSLAAADVVNPVVLLLDNDTAGRRAEIAATSAPALPSHFRVRRLPDIPLAVAYPTLGPSGTGVEDVNGRAASIELYMGRDVLEGRDGQLRPVVWGALDDRVRQYQGAVDGKKDVQEAFRAKVKAALAAPAVVGSQDWSGMEAVLDQIVAAITEPIARGGGPLHDR